MTKEIDFSKPLDESDEAYVRDRPWLIQDAELRGETVQFSSEEEFTVDSDDEDTTAASGVQVVDRSNDDPNQTESEDGDESAEGDDAEASDDGDEGEEDGDEVAPYEEWDYAELKEEAGTRGLSKSGSKEQIIARLQEHDASASE